MLDELQLVAHASLNCTASPDPKPCAGSSSTATRTEPSLVSGDLVATGGIVNYTPGAPTHDARPVRLEPGDFVIPTHMLDELRLQADGIARLHNIPRPDALRWLLDRITTPLPADAIVAAIAYTDGTTEHRHTDGTITRHD